MADVLRALTLAVVMASCALLTSCAGELKKAEGELAEIESWLPGRYDNIEQSQEDTRQGRSPHVALALTIVPIYIPTFGEHVFYLQESAADDPRRITAQRLLSFEAAKEGHVIETLYSLAQPGRWRDGHLNPDLFKGMMYNDATPLTGCELLWKKEGTKFVAAMPTGGCRAAIPALGGGVRLQLRAELAADELSLAELAFNASGQVMKGDAAEPFYRYRKRSAP
jgi:CpeT/CpcT family (DUF1001)